MTNGSSNGGTPSVNSSATGGNTKSVKNSNNSGKPLYAQNNKQNTESSSSKPKKKLAGQEDSNSQQDNYKKMAKELTSSGAKEKAEQETPYYQSNTGEYGQQYHDDIRDKEIKNNAVGQKMQTEGKVAKEAGKQLGGQAGAIAGGLGAAKEEMGKTYNAFGHYRAAQEHANADMATGDIDAYRKAAEEKDKSTQEFVDNMKHAKERMARNVAKGAIDGASGGKTEQATSLMYDMSENKEQSLDKSIKALDNELDSGDISKKSSDKNSGDSMDTNSDDSESSLLNKDKNKSQNDDSQDATNKRKDQGNAITDNDSVDADKSSKDEKKNDPLSQLKKMQMTAQATKAAIQAYMAAKMFFLMMKMMALFSQVVSAVLNAVATIVQVFVTIVAAVGATVVAVASFAFLGIFILAGVIVAGVVSESSMETANREGISCIEQEDWDALDLEYLDTDDDNEAKMICAQIIYGVMRQLGFDNVNIAAVLTNFEAESGIDPTLLENNANDGWNTSVPFSDVYEHANEEGNAQWHAEYGVMLDSPDGEMTENRYLYSMSLYPAIMANADIGSASSRFAVSYSGGSEHYMQDFVNVKGVSFNRPSYIEQDFGFEDIRNTVAGSVVTDIDVSQVKDSGKNTFAISGTVDTYDSIGNKTGTTSQNLSSPSITLNIGPEVGTAAMEDHWGSSYPVYIADKEYKSDWMYCAGGLYIKSFGDYSVAEQFVSDNAVYNGLSDAGDSAGEGDGSASTDVSGVTVEYTFADGHTETFNQAEWGTFLADNLIWGYCDEHQCSGIHQFKANAPSTYLNPTWSYWCVEGWQASWSNSADYWKNTPYGLVLVNITEVAWHTCRHGVTSDGEAAGNGFAEIGDYDIYNPDGYKTRSKSPDTLFPYTAADVVDAEHIAEYNKVIVGENGSGLGPHRVHIPHMTNFHIWCTDTESVYTYWAGIGDSPAAPGLINFRGTGLGQWTNGRVVGGNGQDLHSELSTTGYRGSDNSYFGEEYYAMRNCHGEVIGDSTVSQPMWINPELKNAGLYNYAKSRGMKWYEIETQLQFMLDEEEGDVPKASWVNDWIHAREPDAVWAAKVFLAVWEMAKANETGDVPGVIDTLPDWMISSHSDNAPYWVDKCASWLASRDYSRSMSESIISAAKATSDRGTERAEEVGYCASPSNGNIDVAHAAAMFSWIDHDQAKATPGTQLFVCVRNNVFDPSESHYHSNKGTYPAQKYVYMSCDITAATAIRWGGADDDYPGYACAQQIQYLKTHQDKWMQVSYSSIQPGDVMIKEHHTRIYCGEEAINEVYPEIAGQGYIIAEGSLNSHSPWLSKASPGYDEQFMVFRNVKPETDSKWQNITICDNASNKVPGVAHSPTG